jgi:diguanylate cyclase (GGDEF)-like protein
MLSALLVFLVNVSASPGQTQLFWMLLAACWGVRIVGQAMWMYFDLVLRKEAPNPFVGDILLFLSNVPVLAALLLQPHLDPAERRRSLGRIDFSLLLLWWLFLYLYFVIPWQYVALDEARYIWGYIRVNGLLSATLLLLIGFLWLHSVGRWKLFYAGLFGAQLLMTASGNLANQAIAEHTYYPGSWYDVPYAAALASVTMVGLFGLTLARAATGARTRAIHLPVNRLAVLSLLSLPVIAAVTVFERDTPSPVAQYRELLVLATVLVMAALVFVKQGKLRAELAAANRVLEESCVTDPLTGARNRRFFDATIAGDTSQVLRFYATSQDHHTSDLILYMVDLDGFKEINDSYGHGVGDRVLRQVAGRISAVIRSSDVLVRWGGDEFLIVSRHSSRAEAGSFALRVLSAVAGPASGAAIARGEIRTTCSIGWAAFPWDPDKPDGVPLEAVLGLSDRGVYEAKTGGRNRAIGVSPCDKGKKFLFATAGDRIATYSVQTVCIEGPASPSRDGTRGRTAAEVAAVAYNPAIG